jgi:hypothetical protein
MVVSLPQFSESDSLQMSYQALQLQQEIDHQEHDAQLSTLRTNNGDLWADIRRQSKPSDPLRSPRRQDRNIRVHKRRSYSPRSARKVRPVAQQRNQQSELSSPRSCSPDSADSMDLSSSDGDKSEQAFPQRPTIPEIEMPDYFLDPSEDSSMEDVNEDIMTIEREGNDGDVAMPDTPLHPLSNQFALSYTFDHPFGLIAATTTVNEREERTGQQEADFGRPLQQTTNFNSSVHAWWSLPPSLREQQTENSTPSQLGDNQVRHITASIGVTPQSDQPAPRKRGPVPPPSGALVARAPQGSLTMEQNSAYTLPSQPPKSNAKLNDMLASIHKPGFRGNIATPSLSMPSALASSHSGTPTNQRESTAEHYQLRPPPGLSSARHR